MTTNKTLKYLAATMVFYSVSAVSSNSEPRKLYDSKPIITNTSTTKNKEIEVLYFFNYNCNSCRLFEPKISKWESTLPESISFKSIPFASHEGWEWASRMHHLNTTKRGLSRAEGFKELSIFPPNYINSYKKAIGAIVSVSPKDSGVFIRDLSSEKTTHKVKSYERDAIKYDVFGTPTIIINTADTSYKVSPEFKLTYDQMLRVSSAIIAYNTK